MSQSPTEDRSGQWQQPPFTQPPGQEPVEVSGPVIVPGEQPPPPSALETLVNIGNGVLWPVMIFLGIFGRIPFMVAIFIAIIGSIVLGQVAAHLRRSRRAQTPTRPPRDLR